MPRLSKIGAAALGAFGWTSGASSVSATYLQVAGGGGADFSSGGGGGAGGYLTGTTYLNPTASYTIIIGGGGIGAISASSQTNGGNSSITGSGVSITTSIGGGAGGGIYATGVGANGGSGGGGSHPSSGTNSGGSGTSGQGNNGGTGRAGSGGSGSGDGYNGGGGGGASAVGGNATAGSAGSGGNGSASSISGTSTYYAGGGAGGPDTFRGSSGASGGLGGGGSSGSGAGGAGVSNTGGGGASGNNSSSGGNGGSGVVIISYLGAQQFGGGVVTSSGGYTIHTFNTSGTLAPLSSLTASYLIVAGGGGGQTGGGGAGGLLSGSGLVIDSNSTYLVTVGSGGAAGTSNGGNSAFSMVTTTAIGGGYGANSTTAGSGGSGGGGYYGLRSDGLVFGPTNPGTGTSGQGYAGGAYVTPARPPSSSYAVGTGGGGAGAAGSSNGGSNNWDGGAGGIGIASSISGTSTYYAGGGGGGGFYSGANGSGGNGGGGTGNGTSGTANTGGGGGGQNGNGGSGIVIISYAGSVQQMAGGTVTISGGNVIHTFTSSGYLTPLKLVNNSLRFRSSASAYLNRTFSTPTNNLKWTFSGWLKRGAVDSGSYAILGSALGGGSTYFVLWWSGNQLQALQVTGGSVTASLITTAVYRDPAAWYHVTVVYDSANATASNRILMYVNGVQVTSFSTATYPSLNLACSFNQAGTNVIGSRNYASDSYFDGYMTEFNFIDGQALTPNAFGTFNSYGVWQPITYGGSYGTNGFYLPFTNKTSTTTLGYDFSPNGNNWTTNNISLTTGSTYDSMTDVPTLTSTTVANYATWNPLSWRVAAGAPPTLSNGNLRLTGSSAYGWATQALPTTGKFYCELTITAGTSVGGVGLATLSLQNDVFTNETIYLSNGNKQINGTSSAYGATYTTGDVIAIAVDVDGGNLTFYKNNVSQGTISGSYAGVFFFGLCGGSWIFDLTCGQRPFTYTPPSGFLPLNTYNL